MRYALFPVLAVLCLVGCASHEPQDFDGTWINQQAIEAAAKGDSLRQALASHGPVFEWRVDTAHRQARYGNGFEVVQGRLENVDGDHWQATFDDARSAQLSLDGKTLVQAPGTSSQALEFERAASAASDQAPVGASFEKALYASYLGGEWAIVEGPGQGGRVRFHDDGTVEGLPALDRYALCLAGACTSLSGEHDSLWLERERRGGPWIFKREGDTLEILQAINSARPDEMPRLTPGARQWLLERD